MKKLYTIFLFLTPFFVNAQTWDFDNTNDGWANLASTQTTQPTYWELTSKVGVNNPGLSITPSPAVDATSVSILAVTMKNINAAGPEQIRAAAVIVGGASAGTIYVDVEISKGDTEFKTYYITLSGAKWDGGGTVGNIKLLFKAAGNTNFVGTGNEVFDIDKIEFLASIPKIERKAYNFDTDNNSEGWAAINGTIIGVTSGVLTFTPAVDKFSKISLLGGLYHVNLSSVNAMSVTLTNLSTDDDELRLTVDGNIIETKTISVFDSGEKSYQFNVSSLTGNTSDIALGFRNADQPVTSGWSSGTGNFVINSIIFDNTLSVNEVDLKEDISITLYINPVQSVLKINAPNAVIKIEVYNILGQNVLSNKNSKTLNVQSLNNGIYITKIFQENDVISTKRFIKE